MPEKIANLTTQTSYATNGVGFAVGMLTLNEIAMISTIIFGAGTFFVNWYYRRQAARREQEMHDLDVHIKKIRFSIEDSK